MLNLYLLNETFTNGSNHGLLNFFLLASIFCSIFAIVSKNPVVSVLFLIGLFLNIASYLMLLGINFIGLSYLLVYVGAVSILFILMLINITGMSNFLFSRRQRIILSFGGLITLLWPLKFLCFKLDCISILPLFVGLYSCMFLAVYLLLNEKSIPTVIGFIWAFFVSAAISFAVLNFLPHVLSSVKELVVLLSSPSIGLLAQNVIYPFGVSGRPLVTPCDVIIHKADNTAFGSGSGSGSGINGSGSGINGSGSGINGSGSGINGSGNNGDANPPVLTPEEVTRIRNDIRSAFSTYVSTNAQAIQDLFPISSPLADSMLETCRQVTFGQAYIWHQFLTGGEPDKNLYVAGRAFRALGGLDADVSSQRLFTDDLKLGPVLTKMAQMGQIELPVNRSVTSVLRALQEQEQE